MNKCLYCGKDVKNKYCNVSCQNKHQIDEKYGRNKIFIVKCNCCNNDIEVKEREKLFPKKEKYYCNIQCFNKRKKELTEKKEKIENNLICDKICEICGEPHDGKYGSGRFCAENCSRKYSSNIKKEQKNKKISQSLTGSGHENINKICLQCGTPFIVDWSHRKQKTCSKQCGAIYGNSSDEKREKLSLKRTENIKNGVVNGAGKKSEYTFNNEIIKCDSKIENSCINYFEKLGASEIKRSSIVIVYQDHNNKKRRFLPDFEITMNDEKYLIEAKGFISVKTLDEKWREYNKISEIKKDVLIDYCSKNNMKPFWFTKNINRKYYDSI